MFEVLECIQDNHFSLDDISIISYKTLNGFVLWTSCIMLAYSVVSLFTGITLSISYYCQFYTFIVYHFVGFLFLVFFRYFFLIQILTVLHLVGVFMSLFIQILFNLVILIFSLLGTQSNFDYIPILYRSSMILIGGLMIILNLVYCVFIQFNYLKKF